MITLLATLAAVVVTLVIFNDPRAAVNPFPPPDLPQQFVPPMSTSAPTATLTPTVTESPQMVTAATETPVVNLTPTVEVMVVEATPAAGQAAQPTATESPTGKYAFELTAPPQALSASLYTPGRDCSWMGVAGRLFDNQGRPVKGVRVVVTGYLGFTKIDMVSLSGMALQYGPSGYEFTLADEPLASVQRLTLQLFDQSDLPLSAEIVFDTYAACDSNLILIDFQQVGD